METAEIVKIAVSAAPYSIDKPYDYLVPPELLETALTHTSHANETRCRSWTEGRYWTAMASPWHCGCGSGTSARCLKR